MFRVAKNLVQYRSQVNSPMKIDIGDEEMSQIPSNDKRNKITMKDIDCYLD